MYNTDPRTVVTLDAGGTNFVFGAMKGCEFVTEPLTMPSRAYDLDLCLETMVEGFQTIINRLEERPVAISFAFPGPADYANGIVGGFLPNFPSFRDGVALGPFLSRKFGLPVFINNDGDLFAFGEATAGVLPEINARVAAAGGDRQYRNLLGYTFGTGLGIGSVVNGALNLGNNSCVETFCLPFKRDHGNMVEDFAAIRAVTRVYGELTGNPSHGLTPRDICDIADGKAGAANGVAPSETEVEAAREAFRRFGEAAGDAMATAVTLTDSLIVLGGGLTGAARHILPALLKELRSSLNTLEGAEVGRVQMKVFNLDDPAEFDMFVKGDGRPLKVYGSAETVVYDPMKRTGVCLSRLGASRAISIGAYAYALSRLDAVSMK